MIIADTNIEPTGQIEDDPSLTGKRFPDNPSMSYRSRDPLRISRKFKYWRGHSPEKLQQMKDIVVRMNAEGTANIID